MFRIGLLCCVLVWSCALRAGEAVPLLQDLLFSRGVKVVPPRRQPQQLALQDLRQAPVCLPRRDCSSQPVWQLQQWATAQDIASSPDSPDGWAVRSGDGRLQKRFQFAPDGSVLLEMDGLAEFAAASPDGEPGYLPDLRKPWPHWLLSQSLLPMRLSTVRSLMLHGNWQLLFDSPQYQDGYDASVHAARLVLAMTVRNRLTGNYFWLTLPLYDDRRAHLNWGCQKCTQDGEHCYTPVRLDDPGQWRCPEDRVGEQWWRNEKTGTARMIFRLPAQVFMAEAVDAGRVVAVQGDLLPYIRAGIDAVRQRENGAAFPEDLFFYELGLFAIGWEITGFNHVAVRLQGWQLTAVR